MLCMEPDAALIQARDAGRYPALKYYCVIFSKSAPVSMTDDMVQPGSLKIRCSCKKPGLLPSESKGGCNRMQTCKVTGCVLVICLTLIGFSFLAGCTRKEPDVSVVKTDARVVKTDTGSVSGLQQGGLRVYTGIPFAAPPTETCDGDRPRQYSPGAV